jgi:hypothetical protein
MIRVTIGTLILLLITVLSLSYYSNKEGFDNITASNIKPNDVTSAINTIIPQSSIAPVTTITSSPIPGPSVVYDTGTIPSNTEVVPEVTISGSGYDAMSLQKRKELLRDIQSVVKNEILASRSTSPIDSSNKNQINTDAISQGKEYENSTPKITDSCSREKTPDMSEYIKKDAIPCWGCKLDY